MDKYQNKIKNKFSLTEESKNNINQIEEDYYKNKYVLSHQISDNEQRLLDFISDKKKLHLISCFDQKGAKDFLSTKNEAMEKIDLNEIIEKENLFNEEKMKKIKDEEKKLKIKKKIHKKKSCIINKNKNLKKISQELEKNEGIEDRAHTHDKKKVFNSTKNAKIFLFNEVNKQKSEDDYAENNMVEKVIKDSGNITIKNKHKKKQKKNIKNFIFPGEKESIDSITTVNSKLFNDKKDYEIYKHFITKGDLFIEEIVEQLKSNKNK